MAASARRRGAPATSFRLAARRSRGWRSAPCARPSPSRCSEPMSTGALRPSRTASATSSSSPRSSSSAKRVQRRELERISGLSAAQAKQILIADVEQEARHQAGAAAAARSRRETRHEAERRARNILSVAMQRLAARTAERVHDPAGRAAQRRDEGPDHRPRRAQHPRAREAHRSRRDHRRDALGRAALELRRRPARDRPHHARAPDRRRSYPPGADRGDLRARARRSSTSGSSRRESGRCSRRGCTAWIRSWCSCSASSIPHELRPERPRPPDRVLGARRR